MTIMLIVAAGMTIVMIAGELDVGRLRCSPVGSRALGHGSHRASANISLVGDLWTCHPPRRTILGLFVASSSQAELRRSSTRTPARPPRPPSPRPPAPPPPPLPSSPQLSRSPFSLPPFHALALYDCAFMEVDDVIGGGAVSPNTGEGLEFEVIAAVVIGGTGLYGGQGKILRTIIGVIIIALTRNFLNLARIAIFWQGFATGAIILAAVLLEALQRRISERR